MRQKSCAADDRCDLPARLDRQRRCARAADLPRAAGRGRLERRPSAAECESGSAASWSRARRTFRTALGARFRCVKAAAGPRLRPRGDSARRRVHGGDHGSRFGALTRQGRRRSPSRSAPREDVRLSPTRWTCRRRSVPVGGMSFTFTLEHEDGSPAEPPTLRTAVPNWRRGDTIPLGGDRTLGVQSGERTLAHRSPPLLQSPLYGSYRG